MARSRLLPVAGGLLLLGVVGCAHCDTCDDFPVPCTGPNCGGGGPSFIAGPAPGALITGPAVAPAPTTGGGPFTSPPGTVTTPGAGAGSSPSLPETPPNNPTNR